MSMGVSEPVSDTTLIIEKLNFQKTHEANSPNIYQAYFEMFCIKQLPL